MAKITRSFEPMVPQIELFGDWERTEYMLKNIELAISLGNKAALLSASNKIKRIVRRNIRENGGSIGWPPVSENYAEFKSSLGYDPNNLYHLTGIYYRNITIWSNAGVYYVGLKNHTRNTFTGGRITLIQIAKILEAGSFVRNIQPRPLWKPSFRQFGGTLRLKGLIIWHIRNQIRLKAGVTAKVTLF